MNINNINEAVFSSPFYKQNYTSFFGHGSSMLQLHSERQYARLSFIELKLWRYYVGQ